MTSVSKKDILSALGSNELYSIVSLAAGDRTVVSRLVRMAYEKETLIGWRAINAVGLVARSLATNDHQFLRETCRKLLWSLNDESGSIGWASPELLGEIVSADPLRFHDMVPIIAGMYEIEEVVFRSGVLYALYRIAEVAPEIVAPYCEIILKALDDRDPMVKVRGIALVGRIWPWVKQQGLWTEEFFKKIVSALEKIQADKSESWIYEEGNFLSHQVGYDATSLLKTIY